MNSSLTRHRCHPGRLDMTLFVRSKIGSWLSTGRGDGPRVLLPGPGAPGPRATSRRTPGNHGVGRPSSKLSSTGFGKRSWRATCHPAHRRHANDRNCGRLHDVLQRQHSCGAPDRRHQRSGRGFVLGVTASYRYVEASDQGREEHSTPTSEEPRYHSRTSCDGTKRHPGQIRAAQSVFGRLIPQYRNISIC